MERRTIFQDGMDNDPADFNNLQDFAQTSFDHLVADGLTPERKYAGFKAAATGVTSVTVQPGRLYSGGKVFDRAAAFEKDFATSLPLATRKIVSLVAWGQEVETDQRPREFLINEETGASEPRVVAMERARIANINTVAGEENADPVAPIVGADVTVIGEIVLTPAGVESVTMNAANALDSVQSLGDRTAKIEDFRARAEPQIGSLASDISALAKGQRGLVGADSYGRSLLRLATLEEEVGIPVAAVDSAADFFLDDNATDTAFTGHDAIVEDGVRFPNANSATGELQIFDALNPRARLVGGTLFPAYKRAKRFALTKRSGEVQISTYSYGSYDLVQKKSTRTRLRTGPKRTVSTSSVWWQSGKYNGAAVFEKDGESFVVYNAYDLKNGVETARIAQFWGDYVSEPYWETVKVPHVAQGAQVAETWLQANDMWLDAVGLTFTRLAAAGSVTLAICETDRGLPLLDKVISKTTIEREDLVAGGETVIPVQPVFLSGGSSYAMVIITSADHWLATVQGSEYPQGTFFYVIDGVFQQGDTSRDVMFSLHAADFGASRAVIDLQPLQLAGGISDIDILAESIVPGACQLTYEVQIANAWHPLDPSLDLTPGGVTSPLLPLRVVMNGTPDVMPALTLTGSQVKVAASKTSLVHVSEPRVLPGAGSSTIRVIARLEYFDEAEHDAGCTLLTGAGYGTTRTANSFVDRIAEDGAIERTWIFDLGTAVASYRIRLTGTAANPLDLFHIATRKDYAL
ncbi:hypothetical protein [Croceicoccus sp. YJ47]|uniref:hypothetical protein n=1 Tax=Croceicoccus sp. YJ47 TaxID=2798724 RepID=UPI00192390FA|nr:hypothetical protein [Croceicoccus sp. YJ47]QQN73170.1 hypothetical protein JD971_09845 [Croceicoccus sp. YJ47]